MTGRSLSIFLWNEDDEENRKLSKGRMAPEYSDAKGKKEAGRLPW